MPPAPRQASCLLPCASPRLSYSAPIAPHCPPRPLCRYFTPDQAVDYGIIDRVMQPSDSVVIERRDYEGMLRASQAESQGRGRGGGAMAGADA